ncbi:probable 4-coumarate--CoA ligase 3 [Anopheles ziemanni]|uniref:probable 4-coumarate--CoA ligase 3 n=1 Tax=Anopheles coustani TaxID=139045 RepID=UPI00265A22F7|nr:probable 4-coumarate--CoA ligase 3 [Anopheles coustani]XP_058177253.1 probable 4-coumarate--CoA ligase 3 [Anopheles ziemanni]
MALCTYDESTRTWYGPKVVPIFNPKASVGQVMNDILRRSPDRIIQIDMDTGFRMSCGEFRTRMIRLAQNLVEVCGLQQGDIVTLVNANSENVAPLACALMTIGVTWNPLAPAFAENDIAHMLRMTQPRVIFCDDGNVDVVHAASRKAVQGNPPIYVFESARDDVQHAEDLLKATGREEQFVAPNLGDSRENLAIIMSSSGTTGPPKGVCLTHEQIIGIIGSNPLAKPMTIFNFSPLYWATGMVMVLTTFSSSSTRLITRRLFSEEKFFEAVEKYRANFVFMPPSYANQILGHERVQKVDFSSLVFLAVGGSYVSDALRDRFERLLPNGRTYNSVGLTEIGWASCDLGKRKPGSVGTPTANVSVRIVDEEGNYLGVGKRGEILLKNTESTFVGYYKNEEATRNAFDGSGFFRTGDIGYFDEEGYLYIIDRQKDIFKYRGFHVTPSELEAILGQIEGVREACVVGIPEDADRTTELPTAVIVRSEGSTLDAVEVNRIIDSQVSDFKRLRGGVYFVESLPKTQTGKILRRKVVEMLYEIMPPNGASSKQ